MTGDLTIFGVYVHPLLAAACLAFPVAELAGWGLARVGFYRWVWHRGLFDVAMLVLIWVGMAAVLTGHGQVAGS